MVMRAMAGEVNENACGREAPGARHAGRPRREGATPRRGETAIETKQLETSGTISNGSAPPAQALLTIDDVAALLQCSARTISRLVERGRIPRPCRFGALLRWPRPQVEAWIAQGCPDCRQSGRPEARRN